MYPLFTLLVVAFVVRRRELNDRQVEKDAVGGHKRGLGGLLMFSKAEASDGEHGLSGLVDDGELGAHVVDHDVSIGLLVATEFGQGIF